MLQELSITNFAIIEHLDIAFEAGMTVLTGETGAGKSIIIDAVGLLAGGRGSAEFIRTGADKAVLQGMFILPADGVTAQLLDEAGSNMRIIPSFYSARLLKVAVIHVASMVCWSIRRL